MKKKRAEIVKKTALFGIAVCMAAGAVLTNGSEFQAETTKEHTEITDWDGISVKSVGSNSGAAYLNGKNIEVTYNEERKSSVLDIGADSYLELPMDLFENAGKKVTFSMDVELDTSCGDTAKLFQFNPCGFGIGDSFWKDAPEISLNANMEEVLYIGGRTIDGVFNPSATYNNGGAGDDKAYAEPGGHKTRYKAKAGESITKGSWHNVTFQVSDSEYALFVDGKKQTMTDTVTGSDIASSLDYLFNDDILKSYVINSIGNSVYASDDWFVGSVDNIAVCYDTVAYDKVTKENAAFYYDFSYESIADTKDDYISDVNHYMGQTALTDTGVVVNSPSDMMRVVLKKDEAGSYYFVANAGETVLVEPSKLGLQLSDIDLSTGLLLDESSILAKSIDEEFSVLTGSKSTSLNKCNETSVTLEKGDASFTLIIRAYDDGFAYRYAEVTVDGETRLTVENEYSEYILSDNATTWGFDLNGTYEGEYVKRSNRQLTALTSLLSTPMLASADGYYMLMTEASVYNNDGEYCSSGLYTTKDSKNLKWNFGLARNPEKESTGDLDSPGHINIEAVDTVNGFTTPWRVMIASNDINVFCNSDMVAALNDVPDAELYSDTSYIKPGKVAWSWWAEDSAQGNYEKHKEYIDFAAANGWDYVCLDVGWRNIEDRLEELCDYAASKNVGIFVWINYRDMKDLTEMDRLFAKWSAAGAVGLKTDYFESDEASVLFNMQNVATTAAKYRMMVLYHGCVRPAGEYRTYPNVLSMEAVQGEEWHKWFKYPTTENCLLYPFTRNILGSMDYTPLGTASSNGETYGFAIAKSVVYQSALQHFSNAASIYKKYNGLSLLNNIPTVWDETTVLDGAAGENISMIRRNGENYFYGAMTVAARTESLELGFLGEGEYNAYIYGDNEGGTALKITTKKVTNADVLDFDLLNEGGVAVMFTKEEINLDCYELTDGDVVAGGTKYEAESAENTLSGTAVVENCPLCSNGAYVGWIGLGANNTLQFNKIVVEKDGEYEIILSYSCNENRKVNVLVNGTDSYELIELNSGSWTETAKKSFKVTLKAGENTIQFGNASAYAPNIDYIIVKEAGEEGTLEDVNGTTPEADDTDSATVQNPTNNNKEDAGETTKADGKTPTTGDSSWGMVIAALMAMIVCAGVVVKERKA